jgi:redox-sensitive bicupin YhaK (pirin superfamily)
MMLARARVYSALLPDGFHVVHKLETGRGAWLHVVDGACAVGESLLRAGDAASFVDERSVSLTARGVTELLLIEVLAEPHAVNGHRHHFDSANVTLTA